MRDVGILRRGRFGEWVQSESAYMYGLGVLYGFWRVDRFGIRQTVQDAQRGAILWSVIPTMDHSPSHPPIVHRYRSTLLVPATPAASSDPPLHPKVFED